MIPWLTNSSRDRLCCSFSWRTEHQEGDRIKEEEEEEVGHCRMNEKPLQAGNRSSLLQFPDTESHKGSDITHNLGAS